jgi:signal transduction histidine kinase
VEDVRSTVTDLRIPQDAPSLRETVFGVIRSRPTLRPSILFQVDERRGARPSIAEEVNAIVTEALRNAINHAEASSVTVRGFVDFDTGAIEIRDNGRGFDLNDVAAARFGVVGMRERAQGVGANLQINSNSTGTAVSLTWGNR